MKGKHLLRRAFGPASLSNFSSLVFTFAAMAPVAAAQITTDRLVKHEVAIEPNGSSSVPRISGDGRFVVFSSAASNLVMNDTNGVADIFIIDRSTHQISPCSVLSESDVLANNHSTDPSVSDDGRYVVFTSAASNFSEGDTNNSLDVFVHDRQTGGTYAISMDGDGNFGDNHSYNAVISRDGSFIAFRSFATNLVANDTNNSSDIFLFQVSNGALTRVSVSSFGVEAGGDSNQPQLSDDGRYVVFTSAASNLVGSDSNSLPDVFLHDTETGSTTIISRTTGGLIANGYSLDPAISGDGRFVAFRSSATNLVASDTNSMDDIFVYDRDLSTMERVSVNSKGVESAAVSRAPQISEDGQFVSFISDTTNMGSIDKNNVSDIFVFDRNLHTTRRVNITNSKSEGNGPVLSFSMDSTGAFFAFESEATNYDPTDTNLAGDIFVTSQDLDAEYFDSLTSGAFRATAFDSSKDLNDRIDSNGTFTINALSPDGEFNPILDSCTFVFGDFGAPNEIEVDPNDSGWKFLGKGRYTWKSAKGETPVVQFAVDMTKGRYTLSVRKFDFDTALENPEDFMFSMRLGTDAMNPTPNVLNSKTNAVGTSFKLQTGD